MYDFCDLEISESKLQDYQEQQTFCSLWIPTWQIPTCSSLKYLHFSTLMPLRYEYENRQFLIQRTASSVLSIVHFNSWLFSIATIIKTNSLKLDYSFGVPYINCRTTYHTESACPKEKGYPSQESLRQNDFFYLMLQKKLQQQTHINSAQFSSSFYD